MPKRSSKARAKLEAAKEALAKDPVYSGKLGHVEAESKAARKSRAAHRRVARAEQTVHDSRGR